MTKAQQTYTSIEKVGKILTLEDIEHNLGVYLPDRHEEKARDLISKAYTKSFTLRHPLVTGIPTLGIAPAVAQQGAVQHIADTLMRKNKDLRTMVEAHRRREAREARIQHKLDTERERATQASQVVGTLASTYLQSRAND